MAGDETFARRVSSLGALADPVRRALYRFVSDQPGAVSRSQAADGVDVATHTAKFHLDRLVEEGLLVTEFRRLTGRTGPGAGRPAKLYRRSRREVVVTLPHRRYDLAAQVLADAVERSLDGVPMPDAIDQAAGRAALVAVEETAGDTAATEDELERTAAALSPFGYEPRLEEDLRPRELPVRPARHRPPRPGLRDEPRVRRGGDRAAGLHRGAPGARPRRSPLLRAGGREDVGRPDTHP